jgi:hypothetical protein
MKYRPTHSLHSFSHYLKKVFLFRPALERLADARQQPPPPLFSLLEWAVRSF